MKPGSHGGARDGHNSYRDLRLELPTLARGVLSERIAAKKELHFATREVNTIEINGSFYSLQLPDSWQNWYETAPEDFIYAIKGPRFITHMKKLNDVETPLANFFASGIFLLREKLGPVLWQLPPNLGFNEEKFKNFFEMLPRDTVSAARLAKRHDHRLNGRDILSPHGRRPLRYAVEVRHESFRDPRFIKLLRDYKIALVFADTASRWPYMEDITGDFIYVRLHGEKEIYVSGYEDESLDWWADRIKAWTAGRQCRDAICVTSERVSKKARDVYVYFDNDVKVRAPYDAVNLHARLTDFKPLVPVPKPRLKGLKQFLGPRALPPVSEDSRWRGYGGAGKRRGPSGT